MTIAIRRYLCINFCLLLGTIISANAYPAPTGLKIGQAALGPIISLQPGQAADVEITFTGNATGCAVVMFDITAVYGPPPVGELPEADYAMHDTGMSTENKTIHLTNTTNQRKAYRATAWTYVGGPPWASNVYNHRTNTPYHPGWWGASAGANPPNTTDFIAYGSANGPTKIHIAVVMH
jgi:hypothetical protein